jgi:hypothetical protein
LFGSAPSFVVGVLQVADQAAVGFLVGEAAQLAGRVRPPRQRQDLANSRADSNVAISVRLFLDSPTPVLFEQYNDI